MGHHRILTTGFMIGCVLFCLLVVMLAQCMAENRLAIGRSEDAMFELERAVEVLHEELAQAVFVTMEAGERPIDPGQNSDNGNTTPLLTVHPKSGSPTMPFDVVDIGKPDTDAGPTPSAALSMEPHTTHTTITLRRSACQKQIRIVSLYCPLTISLKADGGLSAVRAPNLKLNMLDMRPTFPLAFEMDFELQDVSLKADAVSLRYGMGDGGSADDWIDDLNPRKSHQQVLVMKLTLQGDTLKGTATWDEFCENGTAEAIKVPVAFPVR